MNRFSATVLALMVALLVAAGADAAPVISGGTGTFGAGASYVITGSGFGSKSTAAPVKFDAFETGTPESDLRGWVFSTSQGRNPVYSATHTRPNSARSAMCRFDNGQYLSSFGIQSGSDIREVYIDTWYLYDPASPASRNHKLFRLYPNLNDGQPNLYLNVYCDPNGGAHLSQDGITNYTREDNLHQWLSWTWDKSDKRWVHIQGYFKESSAPTAEDGTARLWIDGVQIMNNTTFQTRDNLAPTMWHSVWLGDYLGHDGVSGCPASSGASFTYWDDVYIDYTQARVEVGDAATYTACTHREIQIPQAWSSSSITVNVNGGAFPAGANLYLYVVDGNGAVNQQGFPVVLGGQSRNDTTPPAGVTSLAVGSTTQTSATLTWIAVGDDGSMGTATSYDLRYSTSTITEGNWGSAQEASGEPAPHSAGTAETFTVPGLQASTTYYFALKIRDKVPNWSALSNVPTGTTFGAPTRVEQRGWGQIKALSR